MCAVSVGLLAWWALRGASPGATPGPATTAAEAEPLDTSARGRGHVAARDADGASRHLALTVVDADGDGLTSGGLLAVCGPKSSDDPRPEAARRPAERGAGPGVQAPVSIGPDGAATLSACERAPTCVRLRHPTLRAKGSWVFDKPGEYEVEVEAAAAVRGVVRSAEGAPLSGARVSATRVADSDPLALPPFRSMYAITDDGGAFAFTRIERDACDICAEAAGHCDEETIRVLPVWADVKLLVSAGGGGFGSARVASDEPDTVEIRLDAPVGEIEGTLSGRDGSRYARARVLARADERPEERRAVLVRDDGSFVLRGLGQGAYQITVVQDGRRIAAPATGAAGDTLELVTDEVASGVAMRLRVLRSGVPAAGLRVYGAAFSGRETDLAGEVSAERVVPGTYPVRIVDEHETLSRTELVVRAESPTHIVELE